MSPNLWSLSPLPGAWRQTQGGGGWEREGEGPAAIPPPLPSCRGRNPGPGGGAEPTPAPQLLHFSNPGTGLKESGWLRTWCSPCRHNTASQPAPGPAEPTDPSSSCPRHCGPEEAPPVRVFKDVGQHSGEKPAAVQDNLLLLLRVAATLSSLHQLLHSLWAEGHARGRGVGPWPLRSGWAPRASEGEKQRVHEQRQGHPSRHGQPAQVVDGTWAREQPTAHWLRLC